MAAVADTLITKYELDASGYQRGSATVRSETNKTNASFTQIGAKLGHMPWDLSRIGQKSIDAKTGLASFNKSARDVADGAARAAAKTEMLGMATGALATGAAAIGVAALAAGAMALRAHFALMSSMGEESFGRIGESAEGARTSMAAAFTEGVKPMVDGIVDMIDLAKEGGFFSDLGDTLAKSLNLGGDAMRELAITGIATFGTLVEGAGLFNQLLIVVGVHLGLINSGMIDMISNMTGLGDIYAKQREKAEAAVMAGEAERERMSEFNERSAEAKAFRDSRAKNPTRHRIGDSNQDAIAPKLDDSNRYLRGIHENTGKMVDLRKFALGGGDAARTGVTAVERNAMRGGGGSQGGGVSGIAKAIEAAMEGAFAEGFTKGRRLGMA